MLPAFPASLTVSTGCWLLRATPPIGFRLSSTVLVRLDPLVLAVFADTLLFHAVALRGIDDANRPREGTPLLWLQASPTDSLRVTLGGLSVLEWRFHPQADTMQGTLYWGGDLEGPGLAVAGPATATRARCPP